MNFDVVIIGGGPSGLTAGIYAVRAGLSVAIVEKQFAGGQIANTESVDNYPANLSISGVDLAMKMLEHAEALGVQMIYDGVIETKLGDKQKVVITQNSGEISCKAVILCAGATPRKLGILQEEKFVGRGVSYCAVCDGAFFKDQPLAVIGGGDSAVEEGVYLAKLASNVNIIHRRDQLRAQKILQERAFANDKIDFTWDTVVTKINGDGQKVTSVSTHNKKTGEDGELKVNGVFIYVGVIPLSEPFKELGITDEQGWIKTDELMQTSLPGVYAIGDVRAKELRQITTAVGDGSIAGQQAFNYLESLKD